MFHSDICSKFLLSPELMIKILKHWCNKSVGENCWSPVQVEEMYFDLFAMVICIRFLCCREESYTKTLIFICL